MAVLSGPNSPAADRALHGFDIAVPIACYRPAEAGRFVAAVDVSGALPLVSPGAEVPIDGVVHFDVTLERVPDGIVVRGTVEAPWTAACSRCLAPLGGSRDGPRRRALRAAPLGGETYPLDDEIVDLEPLVRDALLLELPAAPALPRRLRGPVPDLRHRPQPRALRLHDRRARPPLGGPAVARPLIDLDEELRPMAVPKRKMSRSATRSRKSANMRLAPPAHSLCPNCGASRLPHRGVQQLRLVPRPPGPRRRVARRRPDAGSGDRDRRDGRRPRAGGDRRGRVAAVDACDVDVLLVGRRRRDRAHLPDGRVPDRVEMLAAVRSDRHARRARRRGAHEEGLVARARARKPSATAAPQAMVGAGNTGATMAAALLRFGRIKGVHRPAIAVPFPIVRHGPQQLLVDGGATVDPEPEWLVEWAVLARAYARVRLGVAEPTSRSCRTARKPGKGDALRKRASRAARRREGLHRQRRGSRLAPRSADVIVTDGFTGNVALKTVEGALTGLAGLVFGVLDEPGRGSDAADALKLRLLEAATPLLPDNTGGAMLLGVDGVCVISHGSSSATAIVNAVRVARDCVTGERGRPARAKRHAAELARSGVTDAG